MKGLFKLSVLFVFSVLFFSAAALAQTLPPFDFNQDGLSDVVLVEIDDNKSLDWNILSSSSNFGLLSGITDGADFGESGNNLIPGNWFSTTAPSIGYTAFSKGVGVVWTVVNDGEESTLTLGTKTSYVVSGGDYDSNGITDAAIVAQSGAATIKTNPFSGTSEEFQIKFPRRNVKRGQVLFLDPDGQGDKLAILFNRTAGKVRRYTLIYSDTAGNKTKTKLVGIRRTGLKDVVPIERPTGTDAVLIFTKVNKKFIVRIQDPVDGKLLFTERYSGNATVLVGDYLSQEGQEFAIRDNDGALTIVNPWTSPATVSTVTNTTGVVADAVNVTTFKSSTSGNGGTAGSGSLASVCKSIASFGGGRLWKPAADAEDARRGKPALLFTGGSKSGVNSKPKNVYAKNGEKICQLTFKSSSIPGINNGALHYFSGWIGGCGQTAGQMANKARAAAGSTDVFVQWKGSTCLNVGNPTGRKGSI